MEKSNSSRTWTAAALAFFALGVNTSAAWAKTPIAGVVTAVTGKPRVQSEGEGAFKAIKRGGNVYEGDVIKTGKDDLIALIFVGGAELRINSGSTFQVDSGGGAKPTSIFSELGQAWTNLVHGGAEIEIHTPTAVCAVRGTQADVDINGDMTVKVYEGHVDLFNQKGKQSMTAGQLSQVSPGKGPQPPQAMTPAQYGTWQNTLKPQNVQQLRSMLIKTSDKERVLELKSNKNGKQTDIKVHLQKNQ
jgi:hypothetical protein